MASFSVFGISQLEASLNDINDAELAEKMLKAAEPLIKDALDAEMERHPGPLQHSLRSTGVRQNSRGGYYLAYRATKGNERPGEISNPQKMIYLTTRQYIRNGRLPNGAHTHNYAIPADDVITKAVRACEDSVIEAMQDVLSKKIGGIFDG